MRLTLSLFIKDFLNQSKYFEKDSLRIRTKRIQTIFQNLHVIIYPNIAFIVIRSIILFIEPSSTTSTILLTFFMAGLLFVLIALFLFQKKNKVPFEEEYKCNRKVLVEFENTLGVFANLSALLIMVFLPLIIIFENQKFDKGIQFMMAKISLEFNEIILMQPNELTQLRSIIFSLTYLILCCFAGFSFINLFL